MAAALLQARGVHKSYPGVRALRGIDLEVRSGEVLAVIGENGAGKSTLMKVLAGAVRPDRGQLFWRGGEVRFASVRDAMHCGIALIHQELNLCDNLSVAENLFLGREPQRFGWVDQTALEAAADQVLAELTTTFAATRPLRTLSIGEQQLVEIAKALSREAELVIMDEPTSSLSATEVQQLYRCIGLLRARGVAVVYISHRLSEVKALADRVVVLRDGECVGELCADEIQHDGMVRLMVGRDLARTAPRPAADASEVLLEVEDLAVAGTPHRYSFGVAAGEVVGIAGLVGSGRSELLRALYGVDTRRGGKVRIRGQLLAADSPSASIEAGMVLIPEDRKQQGLFLEMAVRENLSMASLGRGILRLSKEKQLAEDLTARLGIKTPSIEQRAVNLSGGNQQKVVLGRWLARTPRVLLMDEPTRGVDVSARLQIYSHLRELTAAGMGVLFASSELEEILALSDRVLVMHERRLAGELGKSELGEEPIMRLATGAAP